MSKKSQQISKEKRIERERALKKAKNDARVERKAVRKSLGPAVPLFTRAGQWLSMLQKVPAAIANDEVLLTVAKTSLLLRGMYQSRPGVELRVAIQVLDQLGTGLSGSPIPEAGSIPQEPVQEDAQQGSHEQGSESAECRDCAETPLSSTEPVVEPLDVRPVAGHLSDSDSDLVQPILQPLNGGEDGR